MNVGTSKNRKAGGIWAEWFKGKALRLGDIRSVTQVLVSTLVCRQRHTQCWR